MTNRKHARAGLLLTEIILDILFFSAAAACCLQVFAGAARLSHRAEQLRLAVNSTENLLQQLKAVEGEAKQLKAFYPSAEQLEEGILFFDSTGKVCAAEEQDYSIEFRTEKKCVTSEVDIVCCDKEGKEIYSLTTVLVVETEYNGKNTESD